MTRCAHPARPRAAAAAVAATVLLLAASAVTPAIAQVHRNFPQNALRGTVAFGQPPEARLNGQATRLAPGGRVHGLDNMLVMSGTLIGQSFTVDYTTESNGMLFEVWVLRPAEIDVQPWPRTSQQAAAWHFDPVAQAWSTD
jgi:hypothetical protein